VKRRGSRHAGGVGVARFVVALAMPGFLAPPGTWTSNHGIIIRHAPSAAGREREKPPAARRIVVRRAFVPMSGFMAPPGTWKVVHAPHTRHGDARKRA
jgi:hypothetical protein